MNWQQKVLAWEAYLTARRELQEQRSSQQRRLNTLWWALRREAISFEDFKNEIEKMGIRW